MRGNDKKKSPVPNSNVSDGMLRVRARKERLKRLGIVQVTMFVPEEEAVRIKADMRRRVRRAEARETLADKGETDVLERDEGQPDPLEGAQSLVTLATHAHSLNTPDNAPMPFAPSALTS
ncbi:hypothetical protein [Aliiroseovarius crassostreae]|uniref:hypothetical protein n=1 Tax=Aliiroseovarius crassostreae TaxID=154981 RepID=UPI002208C2AD|nr:hypothetical protein [Aliiroseovarius crassostreae]UWQ05933.1 hypothetical protein K3X22_05750 [Aliiroseovarius crassostreae]